MVTEPPPAPVRLLVVEDDEGIAEPLVAGLSREGFDVRHVTTGAAALSADLPDAVLLDLRLPDIDGFDVCRALRTRSATLPILILSARTSETDRVLGLELGADDYVPKPYGLREVIARVRAVLRRAGRASAVAGPPPAGVAGADQARRVHRLGELVVDEGRHEALVGGEPVALTTREFALLAFLARNSGLVLTRNQILEGAWGPGWYGDDRTVDIHVSALRSKLGGGLELSTIRGVGYRLG